MLSLSVYLLSCRLITYPCHHVIVLIDDAMSMDPLGGVETGAAVIPAVKLGIVDAQQGRRRRAKFVGFKRTASRATWEPFSVHLDEFFLLVC